MQLLTYEGSLLPPPTAGLSQGLRVDDMRIALLAHPPVVPRLTALVSHSGVLLGLSRVYRCSEGYVYYTISAESCRAAG